MRVRDYEWETTASKPQTAGFLPMEFCEKALIAVKIYFLNPVFFSSFTIKWYDYLSMMIEKYYVIRKMIFIKVVQKKNSQRKIEKMIQNKIQTKEKQIKSKIMFEKFSKVTLKIKYLYNLSELERRF